MIRKILAALAVSMFALVAWAGPAAAAPGDNEARNTPAVVTVNPPTVRTTITVLPTSRTVTPIRTRTVTRHLEVGGVSSELPSTSKQAIAVLPTNQSLSYTGISFNVPLTIAIGGLVVLAGFGLMYFGGRTFRHGRRAH